jgi:hypothetical protein
MRDVNSDGVDLDLVHERWQAVENVEREPGQRAYRASGLCGDFRAGRTPAPPVGAHVVWPEPRWLALWRSNASLRRRSLFWFAIGHVVLWLVALWELKRVWGPGNVFGKLQVENRSQAIVQALKRRLVKLDELN